MRLYFVFALLAVPFLLAAGDQQASPVQQRIEAAQRRVQTDSKSSQSYNELAFAYCRKARDTGAVSDYEQAEAALKHSFQLSAGNYDAEKLQIAVLTGKHEYAAALKLSTELNRKTPDDITVWGWLVDLNIATGNRQEAERDAQWILDLRPGSSLGFIKAAALRELFGDLEGAIEFLDEANRRTSQNDADERAWLLTENARLQLASGNAKRAAELLAQAKALFPDSRYAVKISTEVETAQDIKPQGIKE